MCVKIQFKTNIIPSALKMQDIIINTRKLPVSNEDNT